LHALLELAVTPKAEITREIAKGCEFYCDIKRDRGIDLVCSLPCVSILLPSKIDSHIRVLQKRKRIN
jgi:sulfopyruvate decarboxylase TPP-binding subunit